MSSFTNLRTFATLPKTTRGQHIVVGGDPKGKNFLYCNNNSVIIRGVEDPTVVDIYTEHAVQTNVAKYSPSGFYIASGDASGKIRIWDTTQKEHILKAEYPCIGGPVKDIDWSPDSQKIVCGGEGKERFGRVFSMDTGTTVGEISGQSKALNSVAFRPARPFRIATASEDTSIGFFEGPPFKFKHTNQDHSRFATAVKFSPDGGVFVSASMDGTISIFDGKTGEKTGSLGSPAHKGGIYGVAFNADGTKLLSVSGDKTCKVWDLAAKSLLLDFPMGTTTDDMQVGCLWQGDFLVSVSLSGNINYLDCDNPAKPSRVVTGHNKPITALTYTGNRLFSGSSDGRMVHWDPLKGDNDVVKGKAHTSQVQMLVPKGQDELISIGWDDQLKVISLSSMEYTSSIGLVSQPRGIDVSKDGSLTIVACINHIVVMEDGNVVNTVGVDFEPTSVAIHPAKTEFAVGGSMDSTLHVYSLAAGGNFEEKKALKHDGAVTAVGYNGNGTFLAAGDANRKIKVYSLAEDYVNKTGETWTTHTAKVLCLAWCPDNVRIATGSIDTNVVIWNIENLMSITKIVGAHRPAAVNAVCWMSEDTVVSAGHDSNIKFWQIQ